MATQSVDVIVVGLGGMGSAAAWRLARRGQRVLGLEQFGPAHARGSSHGSTRMIRQAYFEDPAYVPLLLRSYELWEELSRTVGQPLIHDTGGLMIGLPTSSTVAGTLRSAQTWDLPHETLDAAQTTALFPTLTLSPEEMAVYEPAAGWVPPEQTVRAHLDLARAAGADLRFDTAVLDWEVDAGGVRVRTRTDVHRGSRLVLSVGPWAPRLLQRLRVPLLVERQVQHWFRPAGGISAFSSGHPVYIWECADGVQFYGFPATGDPPDGVKVAFFRRGAPADPDTLDTQVHPDEIADMRAYLHGRVPGLSGDYLRGEPCLYTTTPDQHFVIDTMPEHPEVVVVGGFSGHGFKFVPVVGELVAELLLDGKPSLPLDLFSLRRWESA